MFGSDFISITFLKFAFNCNNTKSFVYKKKYVFVYVCLYTWKRNIASESRYTRTFCTRLYRCKGRIIHIFFISTSFHNNSLPQSSIPPCTTSCFVVYLHLTVPRLSSFRHVSDFVSVALHLRPCSAVTRSRFPLRRDTWGS